MANGLRIRVGLIGASVRARWAQRAHIPALKGLEDTIELAAVCTSQEETAKASAEAFNVPLAYWDHRKLLADPSIDTVGIITRVPLHYGLTMDALAAGKNVYTEWPLGSNLKEAQDMSDLAHKQGVHTMIGLQARATPVHLRLKELVEEGYVGEVLSVHLDIMNSGVLTRTSDRTWQGDDALGANPTTISFGHAVDAMCMCLGQFAEVSAVVSTQVKQWYERDTQRYVDVTSPDSVLVSGRLEGGAVVSANLTHVPYHGSGTRLEVYGREGTLVLANNRDANRAGQANGPILMGGRKEDKALEELEIPSRLITVPESVPQGEPFNVGQMWVRFAEAISTGQRAEPDFRTALTRHKLIAAIRQSAVEGRRIKVEV